MDIKSNTVRELTNAELDSVGGGAAPGNLGGFLGAVNHDLNGFFNAVGNNINKVVTNLGQDLAGFLGSK